MTTFAEDIEAAAGDEPILAIALAPRRGWLLKYTAPDHQLGPEPVEWAAARPVLDYDYDDGLGWQDCHDFWAWTPTRVLYVREQGGATSIAWAPRGPVPFVEVTQ